jgi:biopolymer transport protein ExbD
MKVPLRNTTRGVGFDMTPMIDIVFQLIIFFLVSSHLAKQEAQLPLPLPVAKSGSEQPDDGQSPRVTLNMLRGDRLAWGTAPITLAEIPARLKARRAQWGESLEVRIRGDRSVPYSAVGPLLRACAAAEVWNVTFAVHRPEDARR